MKVQLAHILQNFFHASSLDEVSLDKLQEIVKDHPYFGTAQFLLTQKLKMDGSEQYGTAVQRTALYFHDPLWLHWQLDQEKKEKVINRTHVSPIPIEQRTAPIEEQVEQPIEERPETLTETAPVEQSDVEVAFKDEISGQDEALIENHSSIPGEMDQTFMEAQEEEHPADVANEVAVPPITDEPIDATPDQPLDPDTEALIDIPDDRDPSKEVRSEPPDIYSESETEFEIEAPDEYPKETVKPVTDEIGHSLEFPVQPVVTEEQTEMMHQNNGTGETDRPIESSDISPQAAEPIVRPYHQTITPEPVNESATLSFDAYYTIDYFASQGIKPPADVQPGDKLGKQLKSFTEWLKTMKRLPQAPVDGQTDETEQQNIRQFAAGSLEQKEVVTETMAEVLIKQDRKAEAIAIYEKLSLLDPSKRAYFAAKIENLKVI